MTSTVVAGTDMDIDHMGLGICIDVPSGVVDSDLGFEIGIPVGTLGHDTADWDSIVYLFHDHYVLDLYYYYPIIYPC